MREKWGNAMTALNEMVPQFRFLGASFWVAWQLVFFGCEVSFYGFELGSTAVAAVYVVMSVAFAVTLGVVGALRRRVFGILMRPWFIAAVGLLASLGTLLTFVLQALGGDDYLIGAVIAGVGSAFLACRSILQFAELGPREVLFTAAAVQIVAFAIDYTVLSIASAVQPWLFFALPMLAGLCLLVEPSDGCAEAPADGRETPRWFWRFVVGILFFAVPVSICRACFPIFGDENAVLVDYRRLSGVLIIAIMLIVAAVALRLPKTARYGLLMYRLILVSSLLYVVFGMLGPQSGAVLSMSGAVNALINLCVWVLLARISFKSGASTLQIFAFGYGSFSLGGILGWAFGVAAELGLMSFDAVLASLVASAIVTLVVAIFLFRPEDLERMMRPVGLSDDEDEPGAGSVASLPYIKAVSAEGDPLAAWRYASIRVAEMAQLSEREVDVLNLIVRGCSARMVSDELCISYNTARNHIQRIYAKLGVHSRDELHAFAKEQCESV